MPIPIPNTIQLLREYSPLLVNPEEDLEGCKVVDVHGKEIGTVDDLMIDSGNQGVHFLHVVTGGFLGMGEKIYLIPIEAISYITDQAIRLSITHDRILNAPAYNPNLLDHPYLDRLYDYYGLQPFWTEGYHYPPYLRVQNGQSTIVSIFPEPASAEKAVEELQALGYSNQQITLLSSANAVSDKKKRIGSTAGMTVGALLGGMIGFLWGLGVLFGLISGVGPAIVEGPITAVITSVVVGLIIGIILGLALDACAPERAKPFVDQELAAHHAVLKLQADDRLPGAVPLLAKNKAYSDPRLAGALLRQRAQFN
jgi:sporulation protein YlmC with PRC-barrel domain